LRAILLTLIVLLASCGRKTYHSIESKVTDSVIVKIEQIKAPLLSETLIVPEICKDSISTEFKKIYIRDTDTIIVEIKDNQLTFDIRQKERIISQLKETVLKQKEELKEKKVKEVIAWKPILILSAIILLFLIFPTIPGIIKRII
jgi:hypothetical protein